MNPLRRTTRVHAGFTLTELIAVIVVLAVLAAVAAPKFFDFRTRAAGSSMAGTFKVLRNGYFAYYRDNAAYPPDNDGSYGTFYAKPYFEYNIFERDTPIGGRWNWNNIGGITDMCIYNVGASPSADLMAIMTECDRIIDDGNTATGQMRWEGSSWGGTLRSFMP